MGRLQPSYNLSLTLSGVANKSGSYIHAKVLVNPEIEINGTEALNL